MRSGYYIGGGPTQRERSNGSTSTTIDMGKVRQSMAGSDRPGGMDNIPRNFNPGKKQGDTTDMGKVARIAHVNRPDRGVKGVSSADKGGGRKK